VASGAADELAAGLPDALAAAGGGEAKSASAITIITFTARTSQSAHGRDGVVAQRKGVLE
jgi:hypothetical protein